jgi:hypothetical protein
MFNVVGMSGVRIGEEVNEGNVVGVDGLSVFVGKNGSGGIEKRSFGSIVL